MSGDVSLDATTDKRGLRYVGFDNSLPARARFSTAAAALQAKATVTTSPISIGCAHTDAQTDFAY